MVGAVMVLGCLALLGLGGSNSHVPWMELGRMDRTVLERHVVGCTIVVQLDVRGSILELGGVELTR